MSPRPAAAAASAAINGEEPSTQLLAPLDGALHLVGRLDLDADALAAAGGDGHPAGRNQLESFVQILELRVGKLLAPHDRLP